MSLFRNGDPYPQVNSKGLVTNHLEGGHKTGGGAKWSFTPAKRGGGGGGGAGKSFSHAGGTGGGGDKKFWSSFTW